MSKERARAREARLAARAAEVERRAKARARQQRLDALKPKLPALPRRRRRYGAPSSRLILGLVFGWLLVQWLVWQIAGDLRTQIGMGIVSLFALPVVAVLVRTPPKGS